MNNLMSYLLISSFLICSFSALSCIILLTLSYRDSLIRTELEIKRAAIAYLCCSGFSWFACFLYGFFPPAFLPINTVTLLAFLYAQIFYYRLFHVLTRLSESEKFSVWHYVAPAVIGAIMLVWSLCVPYEIQLKIVQNRGDIPPEGYETYWRFFTSKPQFRLVFSLIYITLIFRRLYFYYRTINRASSLIRRPAKWVVLLMVMTITSIFSSAVSAFLPWYITLQTIVMLPVALAIFCQHIVMTYIIVRRNYVPYITFPGREHIPLDKNKKGAAVVKAEIPAVAPAKERKLYNRNSGNLLTKRNFESYFKKHKPFLDPECRITDLAARMDVNRTYLSNFVNKTYGVNFNRYMNRCRLAELNRLMKVPNAKEKNVRELVLRAGFSNFLHYQRTLRVESTNNEC